MRTVVALSFLVCVLHLICHLLMGQHVPLAQQEATIVRKWLCSLQEPTAALSFFFFFSWLPVASLSLFSFAFHTQAIKSVSQCCDPLQHSLFLFFLLLFSCSLAFLPLSLLAGLFLGWGGWGWGWNREKKKIQGGWKGLHLQLYD